MSDDYISNLPNGVIGNILSRLPSTKAAVRTCIISKDWKSKWKHITRVNFSERAFSAPSPNINAPRFLQFMEETLRGATNVLSFSLDCRLELYGDPNAIEACVDTAFRSPVTTATIWNGSENRLLRLSPRVLNCTSLVKLSLRFVEARIPIANAFLHLISLTLTNAVFINEHPNTDTMSICLPVLEQCSFNLCSWRNIKFMEMNAPKLTSFESNTSRAIRPHVNGCTIRIIGAAIENFTVKHGYPGNFDLSKSIVQQAEVDCYPIRGPDTLPICGIQMRKLLKEFAGLKVLMVHGDIAEAIAQSKEQALHAQGFNTNDDYRLVRWPMCISLEKLYVGAKMHMEGLLELLDWTPNLKFLHVEFHSRANNTWTGEFGDFEIPSCVISHLEAVEFDFFDDAANQYNLIQYLLANGTVLKRFMTNTLNEDVEEEKWARMVEKLLSFPRASNSVRIKLNETTVVEGVVDGE